MNKSNKLIISLVSLMSIVSLTACNSLNENDTIIYKGQELHYLTNDTKFNDFINDFAHRNMRYDEFANGKFQVGHGTNFAKNWESMAVTFQNAGGNVYGEDKISLIYNHLKTIPQNDQGMIYNTSGRDGYFTVEGENCPHGWPFPTWTVSVDNFNDRGSLKAVKTTAFEFNSTKEKQSQNWKAENGTFEVTKNGYATFGTTDTSEPFRFYRDDLDDLLLGSHGIDTTCAPLIEYDADFSSTNLEDFYVIYKVSGDNSWHSTKQSIYSTTPSNSFAHYSNRAWLQMYHDTNWDNQIVTALGFEFRPKEGKQLSLKDGIINYIRPSFDTRQSNGTYQWILALYNYYMYTQDINGVATLMNKARKALMFLNHTLEGEQGLLNVEYLYGHDGITSGGLAKQSMISDPAHGIGNGYFDLLAPCEINVEANTYYYKSLLAMSALEKALIDAKVVEEDKNPSIINRIPGNDEVFYDYDSSSLIELANKVKTQFEKDIKVELQPNGKYQNVGGFWSPETKRFVYGINEATGYVYDFGFVYHNLEAVCADLGSSSQQKDIMDWIDGTRIVNGDKSTGKDIYFYEFGPRFSTCDTTLLYGSPSRSTFFYLNKDREVPLDKTWSRQVQNGGAVVTWSYYDIVARAKVLGADNAYKRFQEIMKWYEKVYAEKGVDGYDFYTPYYEDLAREVEDTEQYFYYSIQNAEVNGSGALGLDAEFIENVILIRAIPDAFMEMDGKNYHTLTFTHNPTKEFSFLQGDNFKYIDATYSIKETKNSLQIFDIKGEVAPDIKITFKFKNLSNNPVVKINNIATKDYKIEDGYIVIQTSFTNVKVTVE